MTRFQDIQKYLEEMGAEELFYTKRYFEFKYKGEYFTLNVCPLESEILITQYASYENIKMTGKIKEVLIPFNVR